MKDLFENDPDRFNKFHINFDTTLIDFSKHRVTDETIPLLLNLAHEANIRRGEKNYFLVKKLTLPSKGPSYIQH
jgi:glucose-6-phosphate isomerase